MAVWLPTVTQDSPGLDDDHGTVAARSLTEMLLAANHTAASPVLLSSASVAVQTSCAGCPQPEESFIQSAADWVAEGACEVIEMLSEIAKIRCRRLQQDGEKGVCRMQIITSVYIDILQSCLTQKGETKDMHASQERGGTETQHKKATEA